MDIAGYRDEIKLRLTGNLLELELDDPTIDKIIQAALRELQRYICSTKLITVPYKTCIDLSDINDTNNVPIKVSSVSRVYRTESVNSNSDTGQTFSDPLQLAQWQVLAGLGNMNQMQNYMYNYAAWSTTMQIRNTLSTDLAFRYDKDSNKIYINTTIGTPRDITIEYIPRFDDVKEIKSDYWIDILVRLCVALTKVTIGRIRTRYTQSNALWQQDTGILDEGNAELSELRQQLEQNSQLVYPID